MNEEPQPSIPLAINAHSSQVYPDPGLIAIGEHLAGSIIQSMDEYRKRLHEYACLLAATANKSFHFEKAWNDEYQRNIKSSQEYANLCKLCDMLRAELDNKDERLRSTEEALEKADRSIWFFENERSRFRDRDTEQLKATIGTLRKENAEILLQHQLALGNATDQITAANEKIRQLEEENTKLRPAIDEPPADQFSHDSSAIESQDTIRVCLAPEPNASPKKDCRRA
jgi:chromosome segregation ATPase